MQSPTTDVGLARLQSQRIADGTQETAGEVVRWLGAMQAQDYLGSLWAIGLRIRTATEPAIEDAIAARSIVRTWPMRGTLHFVAAEDVRWMLTWLTPRVITSTAGRYRQLELDDDVFARSEAILVRALEGGHVLARPACYKLLEDAGISARGSRGLHILSWLAQKQVIVFGPREGKQHTFTLLDEWVPELRKLSREEALAELAVRYFSSHGPATDKDLSWWSGLPLRDVRAGIAAAGAALVQESVDGIAMWCGPTSASHTPESSRAYLLPPFDEYTVAYRSRDLIVDAAFSHLLADGGMLRPVLVIDGRVVATWSRTLRKEWVVIVLRPFAPLSDAAMAATKLAAERYGAFLGLRAVLA